MSDLDNFFSTIITPGESSLPRKEGPRNVCSRSRGGVFPGPEQVLGQQSVTGCCRWLDRAVRAHQTAKFIFLTLAPWKEEHEAAGEVSPQEMA